MRRFNIIIVVFSLGIIYSGLYAQSMHSMHHPKYMNNAQNDSTRFSGNQYPCNQMMCNGQSMMNGHMMGMMKCGMMGMMHNGNMNTMGFSVLSEIYPVLYQLPGAKDALKLTDDQISKINDLRSDFDKTKIDRQAEIDKIKIDLDGLVEKNASSSQVRKSLAKINDIRTDMEANAYETSQKMLAVLTKDQYAKWNENENHRYMQHRQGNMMQGGHMMMHN